MLLGVDETGKVAALAAVNTSLSAAAGCVSALFFDLIRTEQKTGEYTFDLASAMNGALSALVAITAGCGTVENYAAVIIGFMAGMLYLFASWALVKVRLDDAVDAIPVHAANGIWGMIATGLFTTRDRLADAYGSAEHIGWFYDLSDPTLLLNQLAAVAFVFGWVLVAMLPFFTWLNYMGWFRADSLEELVGLDLSYMGTRQSLMAMQMEDDISDVGSHGASLPPAKPREDTGILRNTADAEDDDDMSETESLNEKQDEP